VTHSSCTTFFIYCVITDCIDYSSYSSIKTGQLGQKLKLMCSCAHKRAHAQHSDLCQFFFFKEESTLKGEYETELVYRGMQVQSLVRSVHRLLCSPT